MSDNHPTGPLGASVPLVPPLYQSAVYALPDLDALDRIMDGAESGFIYARDSHPNAKLLAARVAALENAPFALVTSSGMSALSAIFLSTLQAGSHVVAGNRLYGRTIQQINQELARFGVTSAFIDLEDPAEVKAALAKKPRLLLAETVSNPLLRVADLDMLAERCAATGTLLVVDNTFATPVLTRPLDHGADLVMESLTKIIGGHSDVTLGAVAARDAEMQPELAQVASIWGLSSPPFECWLALRGLDSLHLRLTASSANALELAGWLESQPGVARVIYPGLPDHPDHALAGRVLKGGYGHMLCFDLAGGRAAVNRFMRRAPGIPFSPSLGHTATTCSHPATTSHRYVSPAEKARQGITDGLVRLSVGLEPVDAIKAEMARGLR